eukprot:scaffold85371_cov60-Phaeocystis_antarctica.AAC.1
MPSAPRLLERVAYAAFALAPAVQSPARVVSCLFFAFSSLQQSSTALAVTANRISCRETVTVALHCLMRTLLVVAALVASSEAFGGGAKDAPKKAAAKKASPQKKAAPKKVAPKKWGRGWVVLAEQGNGSVSSS